MVFHRLLDRVFFTWSHIAVLRALRDTAKGFTGREIARGASMSHRSCMQALTRLEDLGIVLRTRGGRDHLFVLNRDNVIVQEGILPLLAIERDLLDRVLKVIAKGLRSATECVILFGSVARREESVSSDLDLCVIVHSQAKKSEAQRRFHAIAPMMQEQFHVRMAGIFYTAAEFKRGARGEKAPFVDVIKDGIVVSGKPPVGLRHGKR